MGLRYAAMSVETSRHGVQLELSRARLVQLTEHLVLSDRSDAQYADRRSISAGLSAIRRVELGPAVRDDIPCHGRTTCDARRCFGMRTNPGRLAHLPDAPDPSGDALLLRLESN